MQTSRCLCRSEDREAVEAAASDATKWLSVVTLGELSVTVEPPVGEINVPIIFRKQNGRWVAEPLPRLPFHLRLGASVPEVPANDALHPTSETVVLAPTTGEGRSSQWALLVAANTAVLHNGQPLPAGLRVLAHRDSLSLAGHGPVFFSTEEVARVEPFAGQGKVTCPRCRDVIAPGQPAVRCPSCGVVHHEADERNCWTYAPTCALCSQPTALDAGLQWTPEAL